MKKTLIHLFVAILFLSCSKNKKDNEINKKNSLKVVWAKGISTLDPACADGFESAEVSSQIYESLVGIDSKTGQKKHILATSHQNYADGLIWDFNIRKGVKFHDGTPMDAESVVFAFQRQIDGLKAIKEGRISSESCGYNYWKAYFTMIKSVKAVSKYKVRFKLNYNYAPFFKLLGFFTVGIVKPYKGQSDVLNKNPVGTGPFKFLSKQEGRVVLQRNENYWDKESIPNYKYLVFQTVADNRQRFLLLAGGNADIAHQLDPQRYRTLNLHPFLSIKKIKSVNVVYIALNTAKPPFSVLQNRLAANHTINRDKIVKLVYQGTAQIANLPIPPYLKIGNKPIYKTGKGGITWYDHNLSKAKALFEEGGMYEDEMVKSLDLYHIRSPRSILPNPGLMANLIKSDFAKVGIKVNIHSLPYSEYKKALAKGRHDMAIHAWIGDMRDPDNFLYGLLHSSTATNYAFFSNRRYNELVSKGRASVINKDRLKYYNDALQIFIKQVPWVPLAHASLVFSYSKRIKNLQVRTSTTSIYNLMKKIK
ncbi:MAG: ABC transporter substrate-binding protein [Deltaproteobacteria bacterium]|jgi:peptide/nickel transport system substrate-binding protein|nr:ABC transporter substrate-binding protein [Deltaproteobacteria bacterium]